MTQDVQTVMDTCQRLLEISREMMEVAMSEKWQELPVLAEAQAELLSQLRLTDADIAEMPDSVRQEIQGILFKINDVHIDATRRATACRAALAETLVEIDHSSTRNRRLGMTYQTR
ncbi:hypothetical protein KSF73_15690 [Burkholderiaceae bacterium DAT-1]|nr:hypothetical protein [Burkholderiaceae bacterium DAT-1]